MRDFDIALYERQRIFHKLVADVFPAVDYPFRGHFALRVGGVFEGYERGLHT